MVETFTAWAIGTKSKEGHGLIGRYWWTRKYGKIAPPQEGCAKALFKTRELAREHLKDVNGHEVDDPHWGFRKAKVVKVKVEISEVK